MSRTSSAAMLQRAFSDFANGSTVSLADLEAEFATWPSDLLERLMADWPVWARDEQLAPTRPDGEAPWRTWVFLGGRGAGKTRAGAEWVRTLATATGGLRVALVGQTIADVIKVMVEGQSGLMDIHHARERPKFDAARNRLVWPNGSIAQFFSAERPEGLRGPQFHAAWCDELVKWRHAETTWDMLQFALRLGDAPCACVTTTPKPQPLLKRLIADAASVVTRSTTMANRANLAPTFITEMQRRYGDTALGRQELLGEVIEETAGALWRRDWIDEARCARAPERGRTVVAVDPPVTAHAKSDACGIVVAARGRDRRAYVLEDATLQGRAPDVWARAVVAAFTAHAADSVVVEVNQGGDLVTSVLRQVAPDLPIKQVRATRGKWVRAEPVAALYAEGRVSHVGHFDALEDQLTRFGIDGAMTSRSPDRLDALVWAMTDLMLTHQPRPSLKRI
ncbi:MAG: terminase family protein [Pseudomonadota bacterium]